MKQECYFCHIKTIQSLLNKFKPEPPVAESFIFSIHKLIANNWDTINPELATEIHRIASKELNNDNLYLEEKTSANSMLYQNREYWEGVINDNDPFFTAAKLAVVGNIIDYGAHSLSDDIASQINSLFAKPLKLNETEKLKQQVQKAKSILYLGDNAGEIFFDSLFIKQINHPNLTYVVRGKPVINDVTIDDAKQVGLDKLCKIITNGYDAPSTLLEYCSNEFLEAYKNADLIISKGQGNFEGLMNAKHPNTFFMLIAKCDPMAQMLGVQKNDMIIKQF